MKQGQVLQSNRCPFRFEISQQQFGGSSTDMVSGQSEAKMSGTRESSQSLSVYCINIRCLLAHAAELSYQLAIFNPHIVLIQESWLNKSVESVSLPNYMQISRHDRHDGENRGGVIAFARIDVKNIVFISNSDVAERSWHYLHLDTGTIAICNWYRPPGSAADHIESLQDELAQIRDDIIGVVIAGDLNIQHARWLVHSNGISAEGVRLKQICDDHALRQIIDKPTRGNYLLDLALTDIDSCKAQVAPQIADHHAVFFKMQCPMPQSVGISRQVWHYKGAAWQNMKCEVRAMSWERLHKGSVDDAISYFFEVLTTLCKLYISHGDKIITWGQNHHEAITSMA